jgi:hypothetical protein
MSVAVIHGEDLGKEYRRGLQADPGVGAASKRLKAGRRCASGRTIPRREITVS